MCTQCSCTDQLKTREKELEPVVCESSRIQVTVKGGDHSTLLARSLRPVIPSCVNRGCVSCLCIAAVKKTRQEQGKKHLLRCVGLEDSVRHSRQGTGELLVCGGGNGKRELGIWESGRKEGEPGNSHQKSTPSDYCCQLGLTYQRSLSLTPHPPNRTTSQGTVPVGGILDANCDKARSYLKQKGPRVCSSQPRNTTPLVINNNQPRNPNTLQTSQTYRKPYYDL